MKKVIEEDLYLFQSKLDHLPNLSDVEVEGSFYCQYNHLTSLKGAPKSVQGNFNCSDNKLTSLEGAPEYVGEDFICSDNKVEFTREDVLAVCQVGGEIYV